MNDVPAQAQARMPRRRQAVAGAVARGVPPHDLGHLPPGHVFSWQNLVAYGVGVLAGVALDRLLVRPFAA